MKGCYPLFATDKEAYEAISSDWGDVDETVKEQAYNLMYGVEGGVAYHEDAVECEECGNYFHVDHAPKKCVMKKLPRLACAH